MSQTRPTKIVTITNDEIYDLATHQARMADSIRAVIPIAGLTEQNGLAALFGGTIPLQTVISRLDLGGILLIWDGTTWQTQQAYTNWITTDTNWAFGGGLIKTVTVGKTFIQLIGTMYRQAGGSFTVTVGSDVSLGPALIPANWRPPVNIPTLTPVTTGTVHNGEPMMLIDTAGQLKLHATVGPVTIAVGAQLSFHTGWYL